MSKLPLLTLLTLTPLLGGVIVLGLPTARPRLARGLALTVAGLTLALAAALATAFNPRAGELQFVEKHAWIPGLAVDYFVGIDGLGLAMVMLTALLVPLAMAASHSQPVRAPLYFGLMLFLESGLMGTFTALNFFHWFLFWELSLVPAFFLIRLWGGPGRAGAATQFFIYTMVGSVAMLLAFLAIFLATGKFNFGELAELGGAGRLPAYFNVSLGWFSLSPETLATVVFLGVLLGLAVKVPLMPFHTWLPSTYAEAPAAVTMLLTGAMSKMGVYGFLRILLPIFPDQLRAWQIPLLGLTALTILASASAALAQRDLKRMLAYSSINHLGYCLLGVFAVAGATPDPARAANDQVAALNGVVLQMFNHGLTAATLFCLLGWIEERTGTRGLDDFGGLRQVAPVLCGVMGIATFSSLGLPGLNGFVGEFLIFKGAFALAPWATAISALGLLLTAVFLLTFLQRVFHGPLNPRWREFPDLAKRERLLVAAPLALMFLLGLWPDALLRFTNETARQLAASLSPF